ncbi:hypothetical protein [Streptomyces sp. CA2R101]|uniref:hypothetical protein n=1 Tax=Streptomyces sp. CA2R101 TaxID=3120152 RepID=UPI0030083983
MSPFRPTPPPYGTTPDYVLAPPRPEERLGAPASPHEPSRPSASAAHPFLPPPRPEDRLPFEPPKPYGLSVPPLPAEQRQGPVAMPDHRRLDLHAALTAAGVAPADGDLAALAEIASLGDTTVGAVIGWLAAAAQTSWPRSRAV